MKSTPVGGASQPAVTQAPAVTAPVATAPEALATATPPIRKRVSLTNPSEEDLKYFTY